MYRQKPDSNGSRWASNVICTCARVRPGEVQGRLPLIRETPHPYVCRTCGQVALGEPAEKCPTCGAWPPTFKRFLPVYWLDAPEPFAALERPQIVVLDRDGLEVESYH